MYWIYMQACVPIESQDIEGTITDVFCCSGPEQYCTVWHLGLDPQTVVWEYTLLAWITGLHEVKNPHSETTHNWIIWRAKHHLWGLNKRNCGIF